MLVVGGKSLGDAATQMLFSNRRAGPCADHVINTARNLFSVLFLEVETANPSICLLVSMYTIMTTVYYDYVLDSADCSEGY